jgi:putative Holliday junction resolvase
MARILGIDYGAKKTGIAVTDPLQIIVNALDVVETSKIFEFFKNYFALEEVEKIVIGQALHADGNPTSIELKTLVFIKKFKKEFPDIIIDRQDEYRTSQEAKEILFHSGMPKMKRRQKGMVDKISAVLILQKYMGHID